MGNWFVNNWFSATIIVSPHPHFLMSDFQLVQRNDESFEFGFTRIFCALLTDFFSNMTRRTPFSNKHVLFLQCVWMGINIFLFVWFYFLYVTDEHFFYTRHLLG
ncbi:hypothetical protein CHARACLAT_015161, partial [Characodon lateralis]|nr:hypothetical protein [Characodon lateralis]